MKIEKLLKNIKFIFRVLITIYILIFIPSCSKDVSVTPPDAPPPTGIIYLDSNPEGFQIYVNNVEKGRNTPDSLTWLGPGIYNITLKKKLFKDSTFSVNVSDGGKYSLSVDFTKNSSMLGSISCTSNPTNAEILINDSSTGYTTPCDIQNIVPGNYQVRFHLPGYRDDSVFILVSSSSYTTAYKFLIDTVLWQDYTPANSSIPTGNLTCVTVDNKNIVYAGTSAYGCLSFDGKNWTKYYNSLGYQINCCTVDNNNILLYGTPRGVVAFNGTTSNEYGFKTSGLTDFRVQTIAVDKNGNWFIGTQGGLNEAYQPSGSLSWVTFPADQDISSKYITTSAVDNNNNVWVGMLNDGVAKAGKYNNVEYYTNLNSKLLSNNVTAIAAGPAGDVWIGYGLDNNFGHGLTCINDSTWTTYNSAIPSYSKVSSIFIDSKNVKWVGTNQGLVMFTSPTSYTLFNYDNTGLNINGVTGIAEDPHGNIWISTNTGLYEYKGSH